MDPGQLDAWLSGSRSHWRTSLHFTTSLGVRGLLTGWGTARESLLWTRVARIRSWAAEVWDFRESGSAAPVAGIRSACVTGAGVCRLTRSRGRFGLGSSFCWNWPPLRDLLVFESRRIPQLVPLSCYWCCHQRLAARWVMDPKHSGEQQTPNAGLMLAQRRRRWANISPALGRRLLFAGWAALQWNSSNCRLVKWNKLLLFAIELQYFICKGKQQ